MRCRFKSQKPREDGRITVTDGPFTESKEVIGGFAMIQATNKEEVSYSSRSVCPLSRLECLHRIRSPRRQRKSPHMGPCMPSRR